MVFGFIDAVASTVLSYCLPAAIHLRLSPHPARALRRTWRPAAFLLASGLLGLTTFVNHAIDTLSSAQSGDGEPEKGKGSGQQNWIFHYDTAPTEESFALARNPGCLFGVLSSLARRCLWRARSAAPRRISRQAEESSIQPTSPVRLS